MFVPTEVNVLHPNEDCPDIVVWDHILSNIKGSSKEVINLKTFAKIWTSPSNFKMR